MLFLWNVLKKSCWWEESEGPLQTKAWTLNSTYTLATLVPRLFWAQIPGLLCLGSPLWRRSQITINCSGCPHAPPLSSCKAERKLNIRDTKHHPSGFYNTSGGRIGMMITYSENCQDAERTGDLLLRKASERLLKEAGHRRSRTK